MANIPRTWATHRVAMDAARIIATDTRQRQRVIREDDGMGPDWTRFRIVPDGDCTCLLWTECVGPGLNLPCGEQHHNCPVHPLELGVEPCS